MCPRKHLSRRCYMRGVWIRPRSGSMRRRARWLWNVPGRHDVRGGSLLVTASMQHQPVFSVRCARLVPRRRLPVRIPSVGRPLHLLLPRQRDGMPELPRLHRAALRAPQTTNSVTFQRGSVTEAQRGREETPSKHSKRPRHRSRLIEIPLGSMGAPLSNSEVTRYFPASKGSPNSTPFSSRSCVYENSSSHPPPQRINSTRGRWSTIPTPWT